MDRRKVHLTYLEFAYDADDGVKLPTEDDAPPGLVDRVGADDSVEPGL